MVSSGVVSGTCTGWKRRSRAASFSICLRYSSSVVAPITWISPRAKGGLEDVGGINGAFGGAGAHHGVELIDKQNDLGRSFGLVENLLEALFELTAVLGAGDDRGQIEHHEPLAQQHLGHLFGDDALGQALGDGGFADAGLTDEHRVVLGAAAENRDNAANLRLAAHHGIELVLRWPWP